MQKSFTVDFLTKKAKSNESEVPQYYVENSHETIIDAETFELIQAEVEHRRLSVGQHYSSGSVFSTKIVCGECGGFFRRKVGYSIDKYRRIIWRCNNKYENNTHCKTPHVSEDELKAAFLRVINSMVSQRNEIIESCREIVAFLCDTSDIERQLIEAKTECEVTTELIRKCITGTEQESYDEQYNALVSRYEAANARQSELKEQRRRRKQRLCELQALSERLRKLMRQ